MVAAAKEDDDGTPHSVVVQIIPEEDNYEDDRYSIDSSGGTRSSDGRSSVGDFDSDDEVDTPHSQSTWKSNSSKSPLREAAEASTPSSCRSEAQRQSPPAPAVSTAAAAITRPRPAEVPKREFEVELVKEEGGQALGLDVLQHEGGDLSISRVKAGLVRQWNTQHPDKRVQAGDEIHSVNGEEGTPSQLVEKIKGTTDKMRLVIRRKNEFDVCIREPGKLGIDVGFTPSTMKILEMHPGGRAEEWNNTATPANQVRPGDHIVQVNSCVGKSEDLLKELKGSEFPMHLVIVRGNGPPSAAELASIEEHSSSAQSPTSCQQPSAGRQLTERSQASQHQTRGGALDAAKGTTSRSQRENEDEDEVQFRQEFTAVQVW